jgi:ech hydrogenase subunit A
MESILFLLFTPLAMAALILVLKHPILQRIIAITTSVGLIGCTLWTLNQYFHSPNQYYLVNATEINYVMMAIETLLAAYIVYIGISKHRPLIVLMSAAQAIGMLWFELAGSHSSEAMGSHLFIDKLSLLMVSIIAIVGSHTWKTIITTTLNSPTVHASSWPCFLSSCRRCSVSSSAMT